MINYTIVKLRFINEIMRRGINTYMILFVLQDATTALVSFDEEGQQDYSKLLKETSCAA